MKRRSSVFLTLAALSFASTANRTTAADYGTAPYPNSLGNPPPVTIRIVQPSAPATPASTNAPPARPGEPEARAQVALLTTLAQEHRERAEVATKNGQAALAKWESDLVEELGRRGSNLLVQLEGFDAQKRALLGARAVEAAGTLSSPELDYLAKMQERAQAIQQDLTGAIEETKAYGFQMATNTSTIQYNDNSAALRLQELGRDISRLQAEQADVELKITHFWALRAMIHNAVAPRSPEPNQAAPKAPGSGGGQ